jgi:putative membrane protein
MNPEVKGISVVLLIVLVLLLSGGMGMMGVGGMGMGSGMMRGIGVHTLGSIVELAFTILVIVGIVVLLMWLARSANHGRSNNESNESPLDILKSRYAKGEITKEQFGTIKRDLGN